MNVFNKTLTLHVTVLGSGLKNQLLPEAARKIRQYTTFYEDQ